MTISLDDVPSQKMCITNQRERKGSQNSVDFTSLLSDDVLLRILSLLDLKEAGRTGALSKRWRYVWSNLSDFDFDETATLCRLWEISSVSMELYYTECKSEAVKFVRRVNQVVRSTLAPSIKRFRVRFRLSQMYTSDVLAWVDFAMGKSVEELELNLSGYNGGAPQHPVYLYYFGCYSMSPSVHSLVLLSLVSITISGSFLESVLSNFPNLEHLIMKNLNCGQGDLNVVGDMLKLRYLEISGCHDYRKVEIFAKNLDSIVYGGYKEDVKFSYVPLLKEASLTGIECVRLINNLQHFGFLSELTELRLMVEIENFIQNPIGLPHFQSLKELEFTFFDDADHSLLVLTNLIDACPVLHKFKLYRNFLDSSGLCTTVMGGDLIKVAEKHHHCLKIFEMVGFRGAPVDIDLVLYLARFAVVIEKVTLDTYLTLGKKQLLKYKEQIEVTRKQAKLLRNQFPPRVQMEIL